MDGFMAQKTENVQKKISLGKKTPTTRPLVSVLLFTFGLLWLVALIDYVPKRPGSFAKTHSSRCHTGAKDKNSSSPGSFHYSLPYPPQRRAQFESYFAASPAALVPSPAHCYSSYGRFPISGYIASHSRGASLCIIFFRFE